MPGAVFRVSRIVAPVPPTASTYLRVSVAMPLILCMIFRITRSQERVTRALCTITAIDCPFRNRTPSNTSELLMTSGCEVTVPSNVANTSSTRLVQPNPASTQSCFARIVAAARWRTSMQAYVVASLVARSSCKAASMIAVTLRLFQSKLRPSIRRAGPKFIERRLRLRDQHFQLGLALFLSVHDVFRSVREESRLRKLFRSVVQLFFHPRQIFVKPLALGAHINLALVNDLHIEPRRAARAGSIRQRLLHQRHRLHVGHAFQRSPLALNELAYFMLSVNFKRQLLSRLDLQLRADIAHRHDQVLQDCHLRFRRYVYLRRMANRIRRQRNRRPWRITVVHRMPYLFRNERHERRQHSQCSLEDADQVAVSRACLLAIARSQPRFDQLQVPVAVLIPEKVVDHVRSIVKAVRLERVMH